MSVYSGFATRTQQNKYNYLLQTLIITLKKRVLKFYSNQQCDESKFKLLVKKLYKKMFLLEKGKFASPKYTSCFTDLIHSLNIQINYETMSDVSSSKISQTFSLNKSRHDLISSGGNYYNDSNQDQTLLKSKNILQSKRNFLLESHKNTNNLVPTLNNLSPSSLKKPYFSTLHVENNQQQSRIVQQAKINRSSSLGPEQDQLNALKQRIKFRKLQDLKSLRGTVHMPKMEDFLPKKTQLQSNLFKPSPQTLQPPREPRGGYRRQKYIRAEVNIQQI